MKHITLFLGVLFAVCVFWTHGYTNRQFIKEWNCIAESGDENLCNEFQECINLVPECYLLPYFYCMRKILPNGAGNCSKAEQAYGSEKQRIEVDRCYSDITTLKNGSDWTSFPEFAPFLDCVQCLGDKCKSRHSESNESGNSGSSESGNRESSESGSSGSNERSKSDSKERSKSSRGSNESGSSGSSESCYNRAKNP